jgi:RND family efflux transporter MFP subunit
MATLVRRDPLLLRFLVPEQEAGPLRTGMLAHFTAADSARQFSARIMHVAAAASSNSRMVDVTAHVSNSNQPELRPGAFARVTVPVGDRRDAPVIPQTAIRPSERGFLAFVVDNTGVARQRVLTLGMRTADGQVEVRNGVVVGEMLVVRGAEALRDGAKVRIEK